MAFVSQSFENNVQINRHRIMEITFRTLMPAYFSPFACLFLNSVTTEMGLKPAFSANVYGMISSASANALKQYASFPIIVFAWSIKRMLDSISGAPPPAIRALKSQHVTCYRPIKLFSLEKFLFSLGSMFSKA